MFAEAAEQFARGLLVGGTIAPLMGLLRYFSSPVEGRPPLRSVLVAFVVVGAIGTGTAGALATAIGPRLADGSTTGLWMGAIVFGVAITVASAIGGVLFPSMYAPMMHAISRRRDLLGTLLAAAIFGLLGAMIGGLVGAFPFTGNGVVQFWMAGWFSTYLMTVNDYSPYGGNVGKDSQRGG